MIKRFWIYDKDSGLDYYINRRFAWIPTYVNGTLIWLRAYYEQTSEPGREMTLLLDDPRNNGGQP